MKYKKKLQFKNLFRWISMIGGRGCLFMSTIGGISLLFIVMSVVLLFQKEELSTLIFSIIMAFIFTSLSIYSIKMFRKEKVPEMQKKYPLFKKIVLHEKMVQEVGQLSLSEEEPESGALSIIQEQDGQLSDPSDDP